MASKYAKRRANAFKEQNGLCYWCKQPMVLGGKHGNPNRCTLDHLYEKWSGLREPNGNYRNVAACNKCNNERSRLKTKVISTFILRLFGYSVKISLRKEDNPHKSKLFEKYNKKFQE